MTERPALAFRMAGPGDDAQLRALSRRIDMPGAVSLSFTYEPCLFRAIEVEGVNPQVVVGERGSKIVGMGLAAMRRVYVDGKPETIGYLGGLRGERSERNGLGLLRGYRYFRELPSALPVRFYLSTIMEENEVARRILTSGHTALPHYQEVGAYRTLVFPLVRRRRPAQQPGLRFAGGEQVGPAAIAAFLNSVGPSRQFFPAYTAEDIESPAGILRGLSASDFTVALSGDEIVGTMAAWNQLPFRQHVATGYSGSLRVLRPAINIALAPFGTSLLPAPGRPVRGLCAACIAVAGDDAVVFHGLLGQVLYGQSGRGHDVLMLGLAANDPLLETAQSWWHLTLSSRIYAVTWQPDTNLAGSLQARVPCLELGSL